MFKSACHSIHLFLCIMTTTSYMLPQGCQDCYLPDFKWLEVSIMDNVLVNLISSQIVIPIYLTYKLILTLQKFHWMILMLSHNHIMLLCLIIMHYRVDVCKFSFEFLHSINDVLFSLYIHLIKCKEQNKYWLLLI